MNKQSFYQYSTFTTYIEVRLSKMLSQEILNASRAGNATTFKIDDQSTSNVEIRGPAGFLNGIPDVNDVSDLRIKLIKYIASPYIHKPEINKYIDAPVVVFEIMDANTKKLDVNISSRV